MTTTLEIYLIRELDAVTRKLALTFSKEHNMSLGCTYRDFSSTIAATLLLVLLLAEARTTRHNEVLARLGTVVVLRSELHYFVQLLSPSRITMKHAPLIRSDYPSTARPRRRPSQA